MTGAQNPVELNLLSATVLAGKVAFSSLTNTSTGNARDLRLEEVK